MINDMMEELDVVKVAKIADRVMEHSTYFMIGGIFFAFLTILILAILIMLLIKGGKTQKPCTCGNATTPDKKEDIETATTTTEVPSPRASPTSIATPTHDDDDNEDDPLHDDDDDDLDFGDQQKLH